MLEDDSEAIIEALFDIVKSLNSDRDLMEFVVPTLDAILTEERVVVREVVESIRKSKGSNFLTSLKSIFAVPGHPDVTY